MHEALAVVCIPVRGDVSGLRQTLTSVGPPHDALQLVVALDGPDPEIEAVAEAAGACAVVLPSPAGSYAARNAAIEALPRHAEIVLFTDAGCEIRPGWVAAHRRALAQADLSGGAVEVALSERPTPAEFVDARRHLRQKAYVTEDGFAATCNLGVRRSVIDVMRFDGTLTSGGDREFCRRAGDAGYRLAYAPDAVVLHPARRSARQVLAKARRVAKGLVALPASSQPDVPPRPRPNRALALRARHEGLSRGWLWELRVAWIDYRRAMIMHRILARGRRD